MSEIFISNASESDCDKLALCLRSADRREIEACTHRPPDEAIRNARLQSLRGGECLVAFDEEDIIAVFGVAPTRKPDRGCVWLLGSSAMTKYGKTLCREASKKFEQWHKRWPILWNMTDARNDAHHRWLRSLGCTFVDRVPHGVKRLPFLEFIHV